MDVRVDETTLTTVSVIIKTATPDVVLSRTRTSAEAFEDGAGTGVTVTVPDIVVAISPLAENPLSLTKGSPIEAIDIPLV